MQSLMLGPEEVFAPFIATIITSMSFPDSNICRKSIKTLEFLSTFLLQDVRFIVPLGREALNAAVIILVNNEKWCHGIEWNLINLIEQIYSSIIFDCNPEIVNNTEQLNYPPVPRQVNILY